MKKSVLRTPVSETRHPLFAFQGFELYRARREDFWLAMLWNEMDPHHAGTVDPEQWIDWSPGVESYLWRDTQGWLFFSRLNRRVMCFGPESIPAMVLEVRMQFAPYSERPAPSNYPLNTPARIEAAKPIDPNRTMRGLILGTEWLCRSLAPTNVSALCFDSESPSLIRFCTKRMGFRRDGTSLIKWLKNPNVSKGTAMTQEKSLAYS